MGRLRPATPADVAGAHAVVAARDTADLGAPELTLGDVRTEWRRSGFAPGADAVVAGAGGEVVAAAWAREHMMLAAVHPAAEGRGLGAELLAWTEWRALALGRTVHRQEVGNDAARDLLRRAGYAFVRSYVGMEVDVTAPPPPPAWPPGVWPRRLDAEADAEALYTISDVAFAAVDGHQPGDPAQFREAYLAAESREAYPAAEDGAPDLSVVAEADGGPLGFALVSRWAESSEGHIQLFAVHPRAGGRGVGAALLREALGAIHADGLARAALGVSADNEPAVRLYEQAGLRRGAPTDRYERPAG